VPIDGPLGNSISTSGGTPAPGFAHQYLAYGNLAPDAPQQPVEGQFATNILQDNPAQTFDYGDRIVVRLDTEFFGTGQDAAALAAAKSRAAKVKLILTLERVVLGNLTFTGQG
jgi:hypothetical protein